MVEQWSFSPLVFSALGGIACECSVLYETSLIEMLAKKREENIIDIVAHWLRRKICFSIIIKSFVFEERNTHEMMIA